VLLHFRRFICTRYDINNGSSERETYVFFLLGISQLTLDEEPEDYESVSDQTSTDRRSGDSLLSSNRQNTLTTFGFVDKNNAPLQSPSHSLLTDPHNSGEIKTKERI
jgi:hypothetical protein